MIYWAIDCFGDGIYMAADVRGSRTLRLSEMPTLSVKYDNKALFDGSKKLFCAEYNNISSSHKIGLCTSGVICKN